MLTLMPNLVISRSRVTAFAILQTTRCMIWQNSGNGTSKHLDINSNGVNEPLVLFS